MHINAGIKVVGKQVILVPYEAHHVNKYHRWMEDAELRQQTASDRLTLEQEYEMQRSWREDDDKCTFIILSRALIDEGYDELSSMIGDVNLFLYETVAELEIMIAEREWRGRGIATECTRLMIRYAFEHLHVERFEVKISEDNIFSINLFRKLGFERTSYSSVFKEYTMDLDPSKLPEVIDGIHLQLENYQPHFEST
uniref:N-acetyltransferase domain-containing protein n=1 Tax=Ascaris lumbricoides TaxID=6252 RepID=A0A0M3HUT0_ASCLU